MKPYYINMSWLKTVLLIIQNDGEIEVPQWDRQSKFFVLGCIILLLLDPNKQVGIVAITLCKIVWRIVHGACATERPLGTIC